MADELRIKQIVINLLSNAVKFSRIGGRVRLAAAHTPEGSVAISVADTGIGMSAKEIAVALQPFGQIESSLTRTHSGTGLGLPITKALAELHGGALRVESTQSVGTTVTVFLPGCASAASAA